MITVEFPISLNPGLIHHRLKGLKVEFLTIHLSGHAMRRPVHAERGERATRGLNRRVNHT